MSLNRIYKSINQDIKLIHNYEIKYNYYFFIKGSSGFIYKVKISKNNQECNCQDFQNGFFCKHINFILFKLLKVLKIMKDGRIKLVFNNSLKESDFISNYVFNELEWHQFKFKYSKIKFFKSINNYCHKLNKIFIDINTNYCNKIKYNRINDTCKICLLKNNILISCTRCKNTFHESCIYNWFNNYSKEKLCPICRDKSWEKIFIILLLKQNEKIPFEILLN